MAKETESANRGSKRDRRARLLKVEHLLYQNASGLTTKEIAKWCGVSTRTAYRDLNALESEVGIPMWQDDHGHRGIVEGYFLPPINFSVHEAMTVFLAARLMLSYTNRYDPNIASTFLKLNSVVPPTLRDQIQKTMDWLQEQRSDEHYLRILASLTEAWVNQRTIRMWYQALGDETATERCVDPYFIEPAAAGHSSYVIGHCHRTNEMRTFKIERIRAIEATSESYVIPPVFDANSYLASAWGIVAEGELKTIKLRFDPELAMLLEEVVWHPSQIVDRQADGFVIITLTVLDTVELHSWILGWGEQVEVIEPEELRKDMADTARAMLDVYQQER